MKEWWRTQNFIQLKCFCERSIKMWHFIEPIQYKLGGLNSGIQIEIGKICLRPVLRVPPKSMQSKGCTKPVQTLPAEAVDPCNGTAKLLLPFALSPFTRDFPLWFPRRAGSIRCAAERGRCPCPHTAAGTELRALWVRAAAKPWQHFCFLFRFPSPAAPVTAAGKLWR